MSDRQGEDEGGQLLSAVIDGEGDTGALDRACRDWRDKAQVRERWHAYHLIGDALRSQDLIRPASAARDAAFLDALRERLAHEPVVLAPGIGISEPVPPFAPAGASLAFEAPARRWRRAWVAPAAIAAGFMAVSAVLVVTRVATPDTSNAAAPVMAAAAPNANAASVVAASATVPALSSVADDANADAVLIRDERLDRYLAAHKQYGGSSALAVPGVVLRSAAARMAPDH